MTQKEIGELRRHFKPDRAAVERIYGCYVNTNREIVAYIDEPVSLMPGGEQEMYLALLKKSLSGGLGRNLIDIVFSTSQVADSDEHRLLMELRGSRLRNADAREALYRRIIDSFDPETNYVILLCFDAYDVPKRGSDGGDGDSENVFSYILCAVCPTKDIKQELQFFPGDNEFHSTASGQVITPTSFGFLFPAFDGRTVNIYNALFYTRDASDSHADVISGLFNVDLPMSAGEQREAFEGALGQALGEECSFEVVRAVNERLASQLSEHRETKAPEPLVLTASDVGDMLTDLGVSQGAVESFKSLCGEALGEGASIIPGNVIDEKRLVVKADELTISSAQEEGFRLETRVIDGKKYILVPVGARVEINGVDALV